jgi:hypothetical protein
MKTQKITTPLKAKHMVVRVTPQDYRKIEEEAKKRKQRMSDFVREACMYYLEVPVALKNPKCYGKAEMKEYIANNLAKK